jgi:hypothetical protein
MAAAASSSPSADSASLGDCRDALEELQSSAAAAGTSVVRVYPGRPGPIRRAHRCAHRRAGVRARPGDRRLAAGEASEVESLDGAYGIGALLEASDPRAAEGLLARGGRGPRPVVLGLQAALRRPHRASPAECASGLSGTPRGYNRRRTLAFHRLIEGRTAARATTKDSIRWCAVPPGGPWHQPTDAQESSIVMRHSRDHAGPHTPKRIAIPS